MESLVGIITKFIPEAKDWGFFAWLFVILGVILFGILSIYIAYGDTQIMENLKEISKQFKESTINRNGNSNTNKKDDGEFGSSEHGNDLNMGETNRLNPNKNQSNVDIQGPQTMFDIMKLISSQLTKLNELTTIRETLQSQQKDIGELHENAFPDHYKDGVRKRQVK